MLASFGDQILGALTWASRQRKIGRRLQTFAERPPHTLDRCLWRKCRRGGPDRGDRFRWKDLRIPCVLYNRRSQQDRPKRRRRQRLGSLETTAQRIRPHLVHATHDKPSDDLGAALEDWLSKNRQHEMFTDRNGRPFQASDNSLVATIFRLMLKSLEETVMITNEDEGFQEFSTKQSIPMIEIRWTSMR